VGKEVLMSFEGYYQVLCDKGHYTEIDCNLSIQDETWECEKCRSGLAWHNLVNTTNGSYDVDSEGDETETRIDGYVDLEIAFQKTGICSCCGEEHVCELRYKIPKGK